MPVAFPPRFPILAALLSLVPLAGCATVAGDGLEITETKDAVTGGLTTAATLTESADNASAKVSLTCTMPGQALALRLESYLPSGDPAGLMRASLRLGSLVFQDATPDEVPYSNVWVFHVSPVVEDLRARQLALRTAAQLADSLEAAIAAFETAQGTWSEEADADGESVEPKQEIVFHPFTGSCSSQRRAFPRSVPVCFPVVDHRWLSNGA